MTLREFIKRPGNSATALARALDVEPSTVSRWANGKSFPHGPHLRKLVAETGQPAAKLFPELGAKPCAQPSASAA